LKWEELGGGKNGERQLGVLVITVASKNLRVTERSIIMPSDKKIHFRKYISHLVRGWKTTEPQERGSFVLSDEQNCHVLENPYQGLKEKLF